MVPAESIDYPKQYKFTQLLNHFVTAHVSPANSFRSGDWLRFLHDDYLDTLQRCLDDYRNMGEEIHQDMILVCQLLFTHETQNAGQVNSARLMSSVLQRFAQLVSLEQKRRNGLVFVEQRMSVIPNFSLDVHETLKGRQTRPGS